MKKFIEKLHFITHDIDHLTHIEQAQAACEAGAKWIQYRCLSKNDDELLKDINVIAEICDDWGATLIVTDHIHLNGRADIQGFHIEDMSADFGPIRKLVGEDITLGGSSNTIENLLRIAQEGADYAGFGPFKETTTKPNNYPHIDLSQYRQAIATLKNQGLDLPILAVGGVKEGDLDDLLGTGIFGIAVSSAINQATDMHEAYRSFYDKIM
ncbi:MAG: thiamine phosphate synthase [Pedobacter sp.]|nr:MAG: thiamine phosphate synthase [Pedobacter sp.]